ncbi:acyl carrier protein [Streptomyces coelicoflavus]|uniref:acyl carrier protein n=1 Tax=Streptomyces coelicoflavus TaxID=285562 RepID=UPI0036774A6B
MKPELLEVVHELFRRELQVPDINPDVPLVDYGLDSIRSISLVVEMEERFNCRIPDEQTVLMLTLNDVVEQVATSLTVRTEQGEGAA